LGFLGFLFIYFFWFFQKEKFVLFSKKIKNLKKNKKNIFKRVFLGGFFWTGFYGWVFYWQPWPVWPPGRPPGGSAFARPPQAGAPLSPGQLGGG
jgi:hypothetical protein